MSQITFSKLGPFAWGLMPCGVVDQRQEVGGVGRELASRMCQAAWDWPATIGTPLGSLTFNSPCYCCICLIVMLLFVSLQGLFWDQNR